jgi:hypothetical protein
LGALATYYKSDNNGLKSCCAIIIVLVDADTYRFANDQAFECVAARRVHRQIGAANATRICKTSHSASASLCLRVTNQSANKIDSGISITVPLLKTLQSSDVKHSQNRTLRLIDSWI